MKQAGLFVFLLLMILAPLASAWEQVGEGIEYQTFTLTDPNNLYVARMDRANPAVTIESSLPQGKLSGVRETVAKQSARLDEAIGYWNREWGMRNQVVVAINGDWINLDNNVVFGGQFHSGWYVKQLQGIWGGSTFAWTFDRQVHFNACNEFTTDVLTVHYHATGVTQKAQGLGWPRGDNELVLYTPQYDATTGADGAGVEVVVQLKTPSLALSAPDEVVGEVVEVRLGKAPAPLSFDCIVLSATGEAAETLLANAPFGSQVGLSQHIIGIGLDGATPDGFDWKNTYAAIRGNQLFLQEGEPVGGPHDLAQRHPRTAVACNEQYVFFIVCDGRSEVSRGMTAVELGEFCRDYLGATWGLNLDGGGSSTMVIKGRVMNKPSDGRERPIGNGLMMINPHPKHLSTTFGAGLAVTTTTEANLRLGPGTNYAVLAILPVETEGILLPHQLAGVFAKGDFWWKGLFAGQSGWVAESLLRPSPGR